MRPRQPRRHIEGHLAFIRQLGCVICGDNTSTEAAHVRMPDRMIAKPMTGIGIKPDDIFTVPLCGKHHREQHQHNEQVWWRDQGLDPVKIALALYVASGNYERAQQIVTRVTA